jgi:hypothetical protein
VRVALTVSPSFEEGFGVEVSARLEPLRGSYHVVKTKGLATDSHVGIQKQAEIFDRIVTEQVMDAADFDALSALVMAVVVSPPVEEWAYMDGTLLALSFERGSNLIALEWNSEPDEKWKGVNELVEFLTDLYGRYRRLRE